MLELGLYLFGKHDHNLPGFERNAAKHEEDLQTQVDI